MVADVHKVKCGWKEDDSNLAEFYVKPGEMKSSGSQKQASSLRLVLIYGTDFYIFR
jgi:hypothetical protein